jgi:ligand-binding SRPBCC domain-containing protein
MRHTHYAEQWLPYPVEMVFDFFANPENLPRLMPAWQKARIEEGVFAPPPPRPGGSLQGAGGGAKPRRVGIAAGQGTKMTISFKPFPFSPFRVPWDAEITEFAWNDHFCDVQHRGPFAYWRHCHRLRTEAREGRDGTLLRDQVEYELPLGPLGDLANAVFVKRQMGAIFRYRQKRTSELLPLMAAKVS